MSIGWIIIHRELMDKPIWKGSTPEQKVVLITLLMMVDFKPSEWEWNGEKYSTKPGEKITSLQSIVSLAGKGISIQNVRSSLKRFEKLEFLTNQPTRQGRLISIVNWDSYQSTQHSDQHSTQQRPNKGPTPNEQGNKETSEQEETLPPAGGDSEKKPLREILEEKYGLDTVDFVYVFNGYVQSHDGNKAPRLTDTSVTTSCDVIDKLIRLDGHTLPGIKDAIRWARTDDFWCQQIKSLGKIRKAKAGEQSKLQQIMTKMDFQGPGNAKTLNTWEDPQHPDYWSRK